MTCTAFVRGFAALVAVALVAGMVELSSRASGRSVFATTTLFTEATEPAIPTASEVEGREHGESSALTF